MNESGILNRETYGEVFRGISQRRKHGTLEITIDGSMLLTRFVSGKIAEVHWDRTSMVQAVAEYLKEAKFISELPEKPVSTFQELLPFLKKHHPSLTPGRFQDIIRHYMLDCLYSLDLDKGGFFSFRTEMVTTEKDFVPSISVGQLLLDLVALQTEQDTFTGCFPPLCLVELTGKTSQTVSPDEATIINVLMEGAVERDELKRKALLSSYTFRETLVNLNNKGILRPALNTPDSGTESGAFNPAFALADEEEEGGGRNQEIEDDLTLRDEEDGDSIEKPTPVSETSDDGIVLEIDDAWADSPANAKRKVTSESKEGIGLPRLVSGWIRSSGERVSHIAWLLHLVAFLILAGSWVLPLLFWQKSFRLFIQL
jgi:hypothetical protein